MLVFIFIAMKKKVTRIETNESLYICFFFLLIFDMNRGKDNKYNVQRETKF